MKKIILIFLFLFSFIFTEKIFSQTAQQVAYVNSLDILDTMHEKVEASKFIKDLNDKYKAELEVMENDYKKKYSDFISFQNGMADNVRLRRMQELKELEQHIAKFMKVAQEDVSEQEALLIQPLRKRVKDAIYQVGVERGYFVVYDLANPTIVFVTPDATDISPLVKQMLGIKYLN